ncbi:MAG: hypothetical protein UV67_C0022G0006 [Parcubacteria group bacterium GW2011_GWC1_43_12]|nr:MAG: hypothetical protein UV67_C0022G0006 [Parcubacteria group bacterium GW2011_GWC1_43_12]
MTMQNSKLKFFSVIPEPRPAKGEAPQMRGRGKLGIQVLNLIWIPAGVYPVFITGRG